MKSKPEKVVKNLQCVKKQMKNKIAAKTGILMMLLRWQLCSTSPEQNKTSTTDFW